MIDYEKLKKAIELSQKYGIEHNETSTLTCVIYAHTNEYYEWQTYSHPKFTTQKIDELLAKLEELTQPQPKYKVGQTVFLIWSDAWEIREFLIRDMQYLNSHEYWQIEGDLEKDNSSSCKIFPEHLFYLTRQELIKSQITYWKSILADEILENKPDIDYESDDYGRLSFKW